MNLSIRTLWNQGTQYKRSTCCQNYDWNWSYAVTFDAVICDQLLTEPIGPNALRGKIFNRINCTIIPLTRGSPELLMCCPVFRYAECHSEHGGSHCGGGGTKSSLRGHATGGLLLWQVPESPAPVSWSRRHHPAQEHVYCAPGHSAGNHISCVIKMTWVPGLFFHPTFLLFLPQGHQWTLVIFIPIFLVSLQQFMELEPEMLATETIVPVYFALEDDELLSIYTQTLTSSSSQGSLSAAEGSSQERKMDTLWRKKKKSRADIVRTKRHSARGDTKSRALFRFSASASAYGHGQRLSDGHQWSAEQSCERLGHHQSRGENG